MSGVMACDILEELPEGVLKEILEPGTGVERPRAGDEVQIAFKGFLPDGRLEEALAAASCMERPHGRVAKGF